MSKIKRIIFETYAGHDCKFFYAVDNKHSKPLEVGGHSCSPVEEGVIRKNNFKGVSASIFIKGAWTEELELGHFKSTAEAEKYIRDLYKDESKMKALCIEVLKRWAERLNQTFFIV
tara:strand:- start:1216 stop:1563 length:348 start_codon:yes stop_codon:yes gene_type:complete